MENTRTTLADAVGYGPRRPGPQMIWRTLSAAKRHLYCGPRYLIGSGIVRPLRLQRDIRIRLRCGLANRLGGLVQAMHDAEDWGGRLRIDWLCNADCGCRFEDLFERPFDPFRGRANRTDGGEDPYMVCPVGDWRTRLHWVKYPQQARPWTVCYFGGAWDDRCERWRRTLDALVPAASIRRSLLHLPPTTLGIHARRGDFRAEYRQSNAFYVRSAQQALDRDCEAVFLATEDQGLRQLMRQRFGSKLLTYDAQSADSNDRFHHRRSSDGMEDALRDLLTLSNTQRIIGTYNSSFSWLASIWGAVPLELPDPDAGGVTT